jgi:hypothetical protein
VVGGCAVTTTPDPERPFTVGELRDVLGKLDPALEVYVWNRYAGIPERFVMAGTEMFGRTIGLVYPIRRAMDGTPIDDEAVSKCPACGGPMLYDVTYTRSGTILSGGWKHTEVTDCIWPDS